MKKPAKILVIDDSKAVHAFVRQCLASTPVELTSAFNGQEGIEVLGRSADYDLIFLDWEMPVMNGPSTLEEIMRQWPHLRVMMMTSKSEFADIQAMLSKGALDYIMKPFTKDIIVDKLNGAISEVA